MSIEKAKELIGDVFVSLSNNNINLAKWKASKALSELEQAKPLEQSEKDIPLPSTDYLRINAKFCRENAESLQSISGLLKSYAYDLDRSATEIDRQAAEIKRLTNCLLTIQNVSDGETIEMIEQALKERE